MAKSNSHTVSKRKARARVAVSLSAPKRFLAAAAVLALALAAALVFVLLPAMRVRSLQVPRHLRAGLVVNAVVLPGASGESLDYGRALAGRYEPGRPFLFHLRVHQVTAQQDGAAVYLAFADPRQEQLVLVYTKDPPALKVGEEGFFLCRYLRTVPVMVTGTTAGGSMQAPAPVFVATDWGRKMGG